MLLVSYRFQIIIKIYPTSGCIFNLVSISSNIKGNTTYSSINNCRNVIDYYSVFNISDLPFFKPQIVILLQPTPRKQRAWIKLWKIMCTSTTEGVARIYRWRLRIFRVRRVQEQRNKPCPNLVIELLGCGGLAVIKIEVNFVCNGPFLCWGLFFQFNCPSIHSEHK